MDNDHAEMKTNSRQLNEIFYRIFMILIEVIAVVILCILTIGSLRYRVYISLDYDKNVVFNKNGIVFIIALFVFFFVFCLAGRLLKKIKTRILFLIGTSVYLAAGIYLITHVDGSIHGDPSVIFGYLPAFATGDYHGLTPGYYFNRFPYQLGFLTFERLLGMICYSTKFFFFVNLLLVIGTDYFLMKTIGMICGCDSLAEKYTVLFSFLFLPEFFLITWLYGQIPGLFFLVFSLFWMIRLFRKKGGTFLNYMLCLLGICLSCQMKSNYYIAAVAMVVVLLLKALREKTIRYAAAAAGVIVGVMLSSRLVYACYRAESGLDFDTSSTVMANLAMGLQDELGEHKGGWYTGYTFDVYDEAGQSNEKIAGLARENLQEQIERLVSNPERALVFFHDKVISTWCAPLFESVWSGPLPHTGMTVKGKLLYSLYTNGHVYIVLEFLMNLLLVLIYGFSLAFLFLKKRFDGKSANELEIFGLLYLTGGFLFHLISETDAIYVPMYVYLLIPYLGYGMAGLIHRVESRGTKCG